MKCKALCDELLGQYNIVKAELQMKHAKIT